MKTASKNIGILSAGKLHERRGGRMRIGKEKCVCPAVWIEHEAGFLLLPDL